MVLNYGANQIIQHFGMVYMMRGDGETPDDIASNSAICINANTYIFVQHIETLRTSQDNKGLNKELNVK